LEEAMDLTQDRQQNECILKEIQQNSEGEVKYGFLFIHQINAWNMEHITQKERDFKSYIIRQMKQGRKKRGRALAVSSCMPGFQPESCKNC
jgi:hypothetical protein